MHLATLVRLAALAVLASGCSGTSEPKAGEPAAGASAAGASATGASATGASAAGTGAPAAGGTTPSSASAAAVLATPLVHCERAIAAIDALVGCDAAMREAFSSLRDLLARQSDAKTLASIFTDEAARMYATREAGALCAFALVGTAKEPPTTTCAWADAATVADARTFLVAYQAARAPIETTGDTAADGTNRELAGFRDEVCACTADECVRAVEARMDAATRPPPRSTPIPPAAMRVTEGLLHDIKKCSSDLRVRDLATP
jgi:hypothetical protein